MARKADRTSRCRLLHLQNLLSTLSAYTILNMMGTPGFDTTDSVPHNECLFSRREDSQGHMICVVTFSGDKIWHWGPNQGGAHVFYHPPRATTPHGQFIILADKSNVVLDHGNSEILNKGDVRRFSGSTSFTTTLPSGHTTLFERSECHTTISHSALSLQEMAMVDGIINNWAIKLRNECYRT